jgi:hypothetical protein
MMDDWNDEFPTNTEDFITLAQRVTEDTASPRSLSIRAITMPGIKASSRQWAAI